MSAPELAAICAALFVMVIVVAIRRWDKEED